MVLFYAEIDTVFVLKVVQKHALEMKATKIKALSACEKEVWKALVQEGLHTL